jgi:DNA polymerase-3 subunit delta
MKREELPGWINARMKSRGLKATRDAVELLAERVEGNLLAAAQEIDKLSLLVGETTLDVETLEASVADDARFDVFRLTDAAIAGDATRALRMVGGLKAEGAEPIPLMGWLLSQLRVLSRLANAGGNISQAFQAERIWDAKQAGFRHALKSGSAAHWERCIVQAGLIDRISKGRANGDAWREIERLIAAIANPRDGAGLLGARS